MYNIEDDSNQVIRPENIYIFYITLFVLIYFNHPIIALFYFVYSHSQIRDVEDDDLDEVLREDIYEDENFSDELEFID